jgi:hypothetical protein
MISRQVRCPYCQHGCPVEFNEEPTLRVHCPHCDETFLTRRSDNEETAIAVEKPAMEDSECPAPQRPLLSNSVLASLVLGVMLIMALVGGVLAWQTVAERRGYDFKLPKTQAIGIPIVARVALGLFVLGLVGILVRDWRVREKKYRAGSIPPHWLRRYAEPLLALFVLLVVGFSLVAIGSRPVRGPKPTDPNEPEAVSAVLPSQLAGLGYLPGDVNLIAGIHVAEVGQQPAGKEFLNRFRLANSVDGLHTLEKWTGLRLAEIDHVALGVKLENTGLIPRLTMVIRTLQPYDAWQLRRDLGAGTATKTGGRTLYRCANAVLLDEAVLWCADDHTLVLNWGDENLTAVPLSPRSGVDHFTAALAAVLRERIDPMAREQSAQVWLASNVADWNQTPVTLLRIKGILQEDDWNLLSHVPTLALWAQLEEGVTLHAACQASDDAAAEKVKETLAAYFSPDNPRLSFAGNGTQAEAIRADLSESLQVTRQEDWVTLQATIRPETIQPPVHR